MYFGRIFKQTYSSSIRQNRVLMNKLCCGDYRLSRPAELHATKRKQGPKALWLDFTGRSEFSVGVIVCALFCRAVCVGAVNMR